MATHQSLTGINNNTPLNADIQKELQTESDKEDFYTRVAFWEQQYKDSQINGENDPNAKKIGLLATKIESDQRDLLRTDPLQEAIIALENAHIIVKNAERDTPLLGGMNKDSPSYQDRIWFAAMQIVSEKSLWEKYTRGENDIFHQRKLIEELSQVNPNKTASAIRNITAQVLAQMFFINALGNMYERAKTVTQNPQTILSMKSSDLQITPLRSGVADSTDSRARYDVAAENIRQEKQKQLATEQRPQQRPIQQKTNSSNSLLSPKGLGPKIATAAGGGIVVAALASGVFS